MMNPLDHNEERKGTMSFCPFLGFEDDPETALSYPANLNYCHHAKPVCPVTLLHQREVCLSENFKNCPVYKREELSPLPKGILEKKTSSPPKKWRFFLLLAGIILAGFIAAIFFGWLQFPGFIALEIPSIEKPTEIQSTTILTINSTLVVTTTQKPTKTAWPTETLVITPTVVLPRVLETPFGVSTKLVIHKLLEGEGYILLAEEYNTTVDAIQAINYELPESLWVDKILVIPINTDNVANLPKFSALEMSQDGLSIAEFAERMQLDLDQLLFYNDLPEAYHFKVGEWVIIPHEPDVGD